MASSSTITRLLAALALVPALLLATAAPAGAADSFGFAYLSRADDPYYREQRAYTGLTLRQPQPPVEGARLALSESRILGRALGLRLELIEITLGEGEEAVAQIRHAAAQGAVAFLLDLPLEEVRVAAEALAREAVVLFNPRHPDDELRDPLCSAVLFHSLPSRAMLADALAQYLRKKGWSRLLLLAGGGAADRAMAAAYRGAARKFGLEILAERDFVLSNDPRQRDHTNVPLMTGGPDYDVVLLADALGEFGRYVPYAVALPRPVAGSEGLTPTAWHWSWERHGAPQLNQRFEKRAGRHMAAEDWAAWAAVRATVETMVRTGKTDAAAIRAYLVSDDLTLDTYKGAPGGFRTWDRQLRQPILLATHNAVIERAPLDGFLHEVNVLDTLGADRRESGCADQ